jgi:uncharacterized protein
LPTGDLDAHALRSALRTGFRRGRIGRESGSPKVPQAGLPQAADYSSTLLPQRADVVSWQTLAKVEPVKQNGKMVPEFGREVLALDQKDQRVQGFMIPLDMGDQQKRFLLSSVPADCAFCMPAGPDGVVEVQARTPVKYTFEPIVVSGRFAVLKSDPAGVLYRLTDATQIETAPARPRK